MGKRKRTSLLKRISSKASKVTSAHKRRNTSEAGERPPNQEARGKILPVSLVLRQASEIVQRLLLADATGKRRGASLKSLALAPHVSNKKAVYAVAIETLKHVPVLEQVVAQVGLLSRCDQATAYVLTRELLWGAGLQPDGPAERAVLEIQDIVRTALGSVLSAAGASDVSELLPATHAALVAAKRPRTARVNELKTSVDQVLKQFRSKASIDEHLPDLLNFLPGTDLHDHSLVRNGSLILQSKASCMPARALAPRPGWHVIDACAAPGNKTTHLAALMQKKGRVLAFDKDRIRLQRLSANAKQAGAEDMIEAQCADFLSIDPRALEYTGVKAILLDPSCSGSGTALSRMDYLLPSANNTANKARWSSPAEAAIFCDSRIESLAAFQTSILRHALQFPSVRRICYSTCSLHIAENEAVVASVLEEAHQLGFQLVTALENWPRRGMVLPERLPELESNKLVRTDPVQDQTDGFFVALFERCMKKRSK